jgi:hypothetical protein
LATTLEHALASSILLVFLLQELPKVIDDTLLATLALDDISATMPLRDVA